MKNNDAMTAYRPQPQPTLDVYDAPLVRGGCGHTAKEVIDAATLGGVLVVLGEAVVRIGQLLKGGAK